MESHQVINSSQSFPLATNSSLFTRWRVMLIVLWRDLFNRSNKHIDETISLRASIDWLCRAWQVTDGCGFSASYSLMRGWNRSYPETTGYLIPTLLNIADLSDYRRDEIINICQKSGDWLLSIQHEDGAFSELFDQASAVFDTGEIIFGLVALYRYTQTAKFLVAAQRAADWLVANQWENGAWGRLAVNTPGDLSHTYTTRPAWALLSIADITGDSRYQSAAIRNFNWVVIQQTDNGWIRHSNFMNVDNESLLHTIVYVLEGLLHGGILLKEQQYIDTVSRTVDVLMGLHQTGQLKSYYNSQWQMTDNSFCLTGLSQLAVVLKQLYRINHQQIYWETASQLDKFVMSKQFIFSVLPGLHGGIGGSFPIWGRFVRWNLVNWAVKFHLDSLILSLVASNRSTDHLPNYDG